MTLKPEYAMDSYSMQHNKPISDLKFSKEGDILFACDKSRERANVSAYWAHNGERIGTYTGHTGAVYSLDVDDNTEILITGGADNAVRLWQVSTGKQLHLWNQEVGVLGTRFSYGAKMFLVLTANNMGKKSRVQVYTLSKNLRESRRIQSFETASRDDKITAVMWGYLNETIITSHSDGSLAIYSTETGEELNRVVVHNQLITSIKPLNYGLSVLTASKDGSSKVIDSRTLEVIKTYHVGRPINCSSFSPLMEHIIMGGGESAEKVTLSGATSRSFTIRFYHAIFGEEMGSVYGHFGPVNTLVFSPTGRTFASGGEDGQVRIRHFPESYFRRQYDLREITLKSVQNE